MTNRKHHTSPAFTLVELLIVIVVIAILATISIVGYNGIQERARAASVSTALSQASQKIALWQVDNPGTTPTTLSDAGIANTDSLTYQYSQTNNTQDYCITATTGPTSYYLNSTTQRTPTKGGCPGHGQGGQGAITNLVSNPKGVSGYGGWFQPLGTTLDVRNVTYGGVSDWHRFVASTNGNRIMRLYIDLSLLENNTTYTASVLVANPNASSVSFTLDFSDQSTTVFTLSPNETRRVYVSGLRAAYDSTFRFIDVDSMPYGGASILIKDAMLTKGGTQYPYADGNSPDWVWNGTANNSTSTGPVQ